MDYAQPPVEYGEPPAAYYLTFEEAKNRLRGYQYRYLMNPIEDIYCQIAQDFKDTPFQIEAEEISHELFLIEKRIMKLYFICPKLDRRPDDPFLGK